MLAVFYEEKIITFLMFLFLVFSLCAKIIIGILYQNMINETENMSATNHKILKQCKLKFANCYRLNNGVANIPVYVEKFLNRLKFGPFHLHTMYHLSGQMMLLSVFFAGVGIYKCIIAGFSVGAILPFYVVSFGGLYLHFAVSAIVDVKGRKQVLKTNLVDYLENHMVGRLENADGNIGQSREMQEVQRQIKEEDMRRSFSQAAETHLISEGEKKIFTRSQEKELEELLRDFLTS